MKTRILIFVAMVLFGLGETSAAEDPSWNFYRPRATAASPSTPAPVRSYKPGGSPTTPYLFGYPRKADPLFDKTPLPSLAPQHLERPVYDRPRYEVPNAQRPSYGLSPVRKPAYQMPLAILPTDNKPRYNPPHFFRKGFVRPTLARPAYVPPNYVIKPTPIPAYTKPGFDRPMWQPPMIGEPTYIPPEYKRQPRYVPPPYIKPAW
jgi:hypothetical protein